MSDEFLAALSSQELFFLAVACHYHDLALAGTEADDRTAEAREQVRMGRSQNLPQLSYAITLLRPIIWLRSRPWLRP